MKPRKRIVLYGGSELTQSILRVVLKSKGYRVDMEMSYPAPDVFLLIDFTEEEYAAFEAQRWEACPQSTVVAVPENSLRFPGAMEALLYKLKLATFRRRGPKLRERKLAA